jgi:hypothetical protein
VLLRRFPEPAALETRVLKTVIHEGRDHSSAGRQ